RPAGRVPALRPSNPVLLHWPSAGSDSRISGGAEGRPGKRARSFLPGRLLSPVAPARRRGAGARRDSGGRAGLLASGGAARDHLARKKGFRPRARTIHTSSQDSSRRLWRSLQSRNSGDAEREMGGGAAGAARGGGGRSGFHTSAASLGETRGSALIPEPRRA